MERDRERVRRGGDKPFPMLEKTTTFKCRLYDSELIMEKKPESTFLVEDTLERVRARAVFKPSYLSLSLPLTIELKTLLTKNKKIVKFTLT